MSVDAVRAAERRLMPLPRTVRRAATRLKLTPPEVARRWGISSGKVLGWIRSGELRAIDASSRSGGRPRYLVDVVDLAAFEQQRLVRASFDVTKSRRRPKAAPNVIQFF